MNLQEAIIIKIESLRKVKNWSKYKLSMKSGVPQSTLTSIYKKRCKSLKVITLFEICEGFNISLQEFFSDPIFDRDQIFE